MLSILLVYQCINRECVEQLSSWLIDKYSVDWKLIFINIDCRSNFDQSHRRTPKPNKLIDFPADKDFFFIYLEFLNKFSIFLLLDELQNLNEMEEHRFYAEFFGDWIIFCLKLQLVIESIWANFQARVFIDVALTHCNWNYANFWWFQNITKCIPASVDCLSPLNT